MDVGIAGGPSSGRTTLFRALLAHRAPREAGARHGAEAVGAIRVPDARLDRLAAHFRPKRATPIEILVHDCCPSLEPSFPTEEIERMKRMDALLLVLPAFADPAPKRAIEALDRLIGELCLEDLAAVEKRLKFASRDKLPAPQREALERARNALDGETPLWTAGLTPTQLDPLRGYALVTDRPFVAVLNVGEEQAGDASPAPLRGRAEQLRVPLLSLCAALEAEMAELPPEERTAFLAEYGVRESAGAAVAREVLASRDTITFFTVGDEECRAWPIPRGTAARTAAGRVHSDMERGFIRAEVLAYADFERLTGGLAEARKRGLLRLEGKDYAVRDGEIVRFRFNL